MLGSGRVESRRALCPFPGQTSGNIIDQPVQRFLEITVSASPPRQHDGGPWTAPSLTIRLGPATGCNAESRGHLTQGQPKPEVTMPATKVVIPALKLACHAGISWRHRRLRRLHRGGAHRATRRSWTWRTRSCGRRSFGGDLHPALAPNGERVDDLGEVGARFGELIQVPRAVGFRSASR